MNAPVYHGPGKKSLGERPMPALAASSHRSRIKSGHVRGVPREAGVQQIIHEDHGSLKEPMS